MGRNVILDIGFSPGDIVVFTGAVRDLHAAHPDYRLSVHTCCPAIFENNPYLADSAPESHPQPVIVPQATNLRALGYDVCLGSQALFHQAMTERKLVAVYQEERREYYYFEKGRENDPTGLLFISQGADAPVADPPEEFRIEYNDIHNSGWSGRHFSTAFHMDLEKRLGVPVPQTSLQPDLHLSETEKGWTNQVEDAFGYRGPFWLINAGHKTDYPLKQWGFDKWQRLVDLLAGRIQFVQVGELSSKDAIAAWEKSGTGTVHIHPELRGVLDLRGKTDLRQLIRLSYHARGAVCGVTCLMHLMGAWKKPCVAVAGGREPRRWEAYPWHRYVDTCGTLPCCPSDGCWLSGRRHDNGENKTCKRLAGGWPLCMQLITPERVAEEVLLYYRGGVLGA